VDFCLQVAEESRRIPVSLAGANKQIPPERQNAAQASSGLIHGLSALH